MSLLLWPLPKASNCGGSRVAYPEGGWVNSSESLIKISIFLRVAEAVGAYPGLTHLVVGLLCQP